MSEPSEHPDDRDDAIWFDALTGRLPEPVEHSAAAGEGKQLRAVLRALDKEEAASEKLDADWERLRFRLRREGLLGRRISRSITQWALAASVLLAVGMTWFYAQNPVEIPEGTVVRGAQATTVVLRVVDPIAVAEQLLKVCQEARIAIRRRDNSDGTPMLDLDMPASPPDVLRVAFKQHEIELPPPGKETLVLMRAQ